jgi:hypothetical protein
MYKESNDIDETNDIFEYDELTDIDVDDVLNELPKEPKKRTRRKSTDEYYVKGAELIEEIRKYQESKKLDAEKRGVPLEKRNGNNL